MKKIIALLLALMMLFCLCACSGAPADAEAESQPVEKPTEETAEEVVDETEEETEEAATVTETTYMSVDAICVDESYVEEDGSPLKMVYLFYTLRAGDSNLKIDSKYTEMTINGINTYSSDHFADTAAACDYTPNYYYSSYIEDVYVGTEIHVIATFKVPEGDLAAGRTITFADTQIPEIDVIQVSTDEIQWFATSMELAQAMDPDGYSAEMLAREDADDETVASVKGCIDGYYWSFYVNNTSYEIEFSSNNTFEVRTAFGANSGDYSVKNGYIFCTYPDTGYTVEIPYTLADGEIDLDVVAGFDVH